MKIGITLHPYGEKKPAGLGRAILEIVRSLLLVDQKNEHTIFLKSFTNPEHDEISESRRSRQTELAQVCPDGLSAKKFHHVPDLPGNNWCVALMNRKTLREVDVCIFNTPILPLFYKAKKSIIIAYDFAYWHFGKNYLLWLYHAYSLWRADHIIAISEATKRDLIKLFRIPDRKVTVIYLGYKKVCELSPTEAPGVPEKFFLFIGAIKERKNVLGIIRAFHQFTKAVSNNHVLVIAGNGSGAYYEKICSYIAENNLSLRVMFLGHITDNNLSYLYQKAEALLYPSFIEGFGFPVLEAMQCGLPVVTSNAYSLPELAGDAAICVDPHDVNAIADAMKKIVQDPVFREGLIQKGNVQAQKFSWGKTAQKYLEIIRLVS